MSATKGHCCFIPDHQQGEARAAAQALFDAGKGPPIGCQQGAEWNIHADSDPPDVVTQSCSDHIGLMLSDKGHHSVWPVE